MSRPARTLATIPVSDSYRLAKDEYSWAVEELRVPQKGKLAGVATWQAKKWFPSLGHALSWLLETLAASDPAVTTLGELREAMARYHTDLMRIAREEGA